MQISHGRRSSVPSNGATGRPWRSMTQPVRGRAFVLDASPARRRVRCGRPARSSPPGDRAARPRPRRRRRGAPAPCAGRLGGAAPVARARSNGTSNASAARVAVGRAPVAARGAAPRTRPAGGPGAARPRRARSGRPDSGAARARSARGTRPRAAGCSASSRAVVDHLVLEQPVVHEREPDGAVGRVDEAARRERREPVLVRAALGGRAPRCTTANAHSASEPATARGEREVRAEPVVARSVVELVRDPQEALAGAELERGRDGHRHRLVAARTSTSGRRRCACAGHV